MRTLLLILATLLLSSCGAPHWTPCKPYTDQTKGDYGTPNSMVTLSTPREYIEPGVIYYYYEKGFAKVFDVSVANDGHSECHDHLIVTDALLFSQNCKRAECAQAVIDVIPGLPGTTTSN